MTTNNPNEAPHFTREWLIDALRYVRRDFEAAASPARLPSLAMGATPAPVRAWKRRAAWGWTPSPTRRWPR